jgi:hypothetical protein
MADEGDGRDSYGDQARQRPDAPRSTSPAQESGAELDPLRTGQIPTEETGERRWMREARERLGAVDAPEAQDWMRAQAKAMGRGNQLGPDAQQDEMGTGGEPDQPGSAQSDDDAV